MLVIPRCAILALALVGTLMGCRTGEITFVEPEIPHFAQEGRWDGEFVYEHDEKHGYWQCTYIAPDKVVYPFQCGELLIGLKPGVNPDDLRDLFEAINGRPGGYRDWGPGYSWMEVHVTMRTERESLIRAKEDPRLRFANLSFTGPAICMDAAGCGRQ